MNKKTMIIGFSGGRTSAYMAKWLVDNMSHLYNFIFLFANTGLEHLNTLLFVDECDRKWGLNVIWLEAVIHPKANDGTTHKIVDFQTATRNRSLFESMVKKYGISNKAYPHCNRELKQRVIESWRRDNDLTKCEYAIGLRADEFDRMNPRASERNIVYPLIGMKYSTKPEIIHWWKQQAFDLQVPEHYGNCVTCWKKSARKQLTIAKNTPEYFDDFNYLEQNYACSGAGGKPRQFNSGVKFKQETISIKELVYKASNEDFEEFKEIDPEYQIDMFGLDNPDGCEETCEAFAA